MMRKEGFYWVRIRVGEGYRWVVAEWFGYGWSWQGGKYDSVNFVEIDEQQIIRK